MPFFSVIIPVFNKERFVAATVQSVLDQSCSDFEIIIVNDGSTDASESTIKAFNDTRIRYFSQTNKGVSAARNLGISEAKADFICFLDADDYWCPTFLETLQTYILKLPEQKVFGMAYEIETSEKTFPAQYSIETTGDFEVVEYFKASRKESVLWTSSAAFHKTVFSTTGDFNEGLKNMEDIDLWIRIGLQYPIVFINKIQAKYGFDADGLSRKNKASAVTIDFTVYDALGKTNPDLKLYLDLNRFSLAVKSKLHNDESSFRKYYEAIDLKKFPLKKRILLSLPGFVLRMLVLLKLKLTNLGLGNSVFR